MILELEQTDKELECTTNDPVVNNGNTGIFRGKHPLISFGTFESAKHSGNLILLDSELQIDLNNFNDEVRIFKLYSDQIHAFHSSAAFVNTQYAPMVSQYLANDINDKIKKIAIDLKNLLPKLKQSLNSNPES